MTVAPLGLVGVVVPVRDEARRIGACLDAVALAATAVDLPVRVVAVLDRCVDDTAAQVAAHGEVTAVVVDGPAGVGRARAAGVEQVLSEPWVRTHLPQVWLAHTDADSLVPADWLVRMSMLADRGIDLVLGPVVPDDAAPCHVRQRWRTLHPFVEGHHHVFGANLGVRASTYLAAGGFDHAGVGEDAALAARVAGLPGVRVARPADHPVVTSGRLGSRVVGGFASFLADLAGVDAADTVETRCLPTEPHTW